MTSEAEAKFERWRARSLVSSYVGPLGLLGRLRKPATLNRIQTLLLSGFKSWGVRRVGASYQRGWLVAITEDEYFAKALCPEPQSPGPATGRPGRLRALARDLVCTHRRALKESLQLRREILAFLDQVDAPEDRKDQVRRALPTFPRPGLAALDVAKEPTGDHVHPDLRFLEFQEEDEASLVKRVAEVLGEQERLDDDCAAQRAAAAAIVLPIVPTLA